MAAEDRSGYGRVQQGEHGDTAGVVGGGDAFTARREMREREGPHQVSVADMGREDSYVAACEAAGLQLRFRDDQHRYFQPPPGQRRDVHVHVCQQGSDWERLHLLFRDYLRASADARELYAAAKREAARLWADQGAAYTEAKSDVILDILTRAEAWADVTGWVI